MSKQLKECSRDRDFLVHRRRPDMDSPSSFNKFPKELVAEIMSRLPAESLMQFKLVNKFFYSLTISLIKDPEFMAKHLLYSKPDNMSSRTSFVIFRLHPKTNPTEESEFSPKERIVSLLTVLSNEDDKKGRLHCAIEDLDLPFNSVGENRFWFSKLRGCCSLEAYQCNGTICLFNDEQTVTLCNPALCKRKMYSPESDLDGFLGMGFGWDSKANNHKIVRISNEWIAEVYDFGSARSWREIGVTVDKEVREKCWFLQSPVYFKGTCYWLMMMGFRMDMVLSFDLSSEVFRTILLPDDLDKFEGSNLRLTVWDGYVCLFLYPEDPDKRGEISESIQMWIMDVVYDSVDRGCSYSWRKYLTVEPLKAVYSPLTFWEDSELLMEAQGGGLVSYNLVTRNLRTVSVCGIELEKILHSGLFMKSLGFLQ